QQYGQGRQQNPAIFTKKLQPQGGLVSFLKQDLKFGNKLRIGTSAGRLAGMRRHGSAGAKQLFAQNMDLFTLFRKGDVKPNCAGGKGLAALAKFFR
ncbi:MAG: hypothetical protein RIQ79_1233, partial [Verrucomicrobiota bacterium]